MGMRPLQPTDLQGSILPESMASEQAEAVDAPVLPSAFRQEFEPAAAAAKWGNFPGRVTPAELQAINDGTFDYEALIPDEFQEYKAEYAKYALSERHASWVTENIRQQQRDRQTISESGATGFIASSFAAMASPEQWPTYYIPGAVLLKPGVLRGSRAGLVTTEVGAAVAGAGAGEMMLHESQVTRTAEESAYAIAASALFSGMLTAGLTTFKGVGRSAQEFAADLDADMRVMDGDVRADEVDPRHAGAAEAREDVFETHRALLEDAELNLRNAADTGEARAVENAQAKVESLKAMDPRELSRLKHPKLAKALGWASPAVRLAGSRVHAAREMAAMLIDDPMTRVRNSYGDTLPPSIESQMSQFEQQMGFKVQTVLDESYGAYKTAKKAEGQVALAREDFAREISRAMRNGDEAADGDTFVTSTAKMLRSEVAEPIQTRLDTQDMLDRRVNNWDDLTADDLVDLVEPDLIPQFFKQDGMPKANIKSIPADARDILVQTGKLQTEIRQPSGDKSYLHRLWDFAAVQERPNVFEKRVGDYFYEQAEREIRARTVQKAEKLIVAKEQAAVVAETKAAKAKRKPEVIERTHKEFKAHVEAQKAAGEKITRRSNAQIAHDLRQEISHLREIELPAAKRNYDAQLVTARSEATNAAREVRAKIEGSQYNPSMGAERATFSVGPLKARTLNIPSHIIDDFLENDIEKVIGHYVRDVNAPLHFKETFDPSAVGSVKVGKEPQLTGSQAFTDRMADVERMYDDMVQAEFAKGDTKAAQKIRKEWKSVKEDMGAMHESLFNRYKLPDNPDGFWHKARQRLKEFNVMTMLGMVTISSVPDIGNYIARRGLVAFTRDMGRLATNMKAMKLSSQMNKKLGISADLMNSGRLEKLYLLDDYQPPISKETMGGKVLNGWQNTRQVFTKATGMPYWNNFWKSMTATSYIDDIAVDSMKAVRGELSDHAIEQYARGGISLKDLQAVSRNLKESRDMVDGVWVPQIDEWADQALADRFKAAVRKEVDMTVVTPGKGDLPLMSKSEVGKLVFQFKSFAMSANNRILMAGLDDFTANRVAGTMAMVLLGYTSYASRETLKGKEVKTDYDTFIREGIDRSGLLAYWGDLNGMVSKATAGEADMFRALGADKGQLSRYASRNLLGSVMGVSAGRVSDLGQITGAIASGDFRESDIRAVRRAIIFNNLWATHRGFSEIEKAVGGSK